MIDSNGENMLFQSVWIKQPFKNDTLLFKLSNTKNKINHFSQCMWLETLFSIGCFTTNKDTILLVEVVYDLAYEFCYCVEISMNQIPTKSWHLVQWHYYFFGGVSNDCALSPPKTIMGIGAVSLGLFILGVSNDRASSKPNKIWSPGALQLELLFLGVSNDWVSLSKIIFEINMSFEYGLDTDFFWMMLEGLSSREKIFLECDSAVNTFVVVI